MKKILIGLFALTGLSVSAQNFTRDSFIPAKYLYITNTSTYLTNLATYIDIPNGSTNLSTVIITNTSTGTNYTTNTVGGLNVNTVNPFVDVPFSIDRNNPFISGQATNQCIEVGLGYAGANATNGVTLVFIGMLSGPPYPNVEDTTSSALTLSTTVNSGTNGTYRFAVPYSQFIGDWGLRLQKVYMVNASSAAQSQIVITNISLNGRTP